MPSTQRIGRPPSLRGTPGNGRPRAPLILVVDDDLGVRKMVCRLLQREGYRLLEAHDGQKAMAVGSQHLKEIDLLLTDIRMPEMDGCELARRLSGLRPGLPVIFMSGYQDQELAPEALLLRKPFAPGALTHLVRQTLAVCR